MKFKVYLKNGILAFQNHPLIIPGVEAGKLTVDYRVACLDHFLTMWISRTWRNWWSMIHIFNLYLVKPWPQVFLPSVSHLSSQSPSPIWEPPQRAASHLTDWGSDRTTQTIRTACWILCLGYPGLYPPDWINLISYCKSFLLQEWCSRKNQDANRCVCWQAVSSWRACNG